jgi:hypothetical protein
MKLQSIVRIGRPQPVVIKLVLSYRPKPTVLLRSERSGMKNVTQGHLSDGSLEEYSLDNLPESSLTVVEEHLLVCGQCRARLEGIEPINYIHYTEDGPVYESATRLTRTCLKESDSEPQERTLL